MDKVQKQLIDTYFRKRKMIGYTNKKYEDYEELYLLNNNSIELNNIYNTNLRAKYINDKYGTKFKEVYNFDEYGKNIALAEDFNGAFFYINKEGKKTIEDIYYDKIKQPLYICAYINTKYNKNYMNLSDLNRFTNGIGIGSLKDSNKIFINMQGEPDVGDLTPDKIINSSYANTLKQSAKGQSVLNAILDIYNNTLRLLNNNN